MFLQHINDFPALSTRERGGRFQAFDQPEMGAEKLVEFRWSYAERWTTPVRFFAWIPRIQIKYGQKTSKRF